MSSADAATNPSKLLSRIIIWTAALALPTAIVSWWVWDSATALGILAGATLGGLNFWLLGRSLQKMFANPEEHRTGSKWTVPATMLLKWPLLLGGLAIVLLYLPVSAQGVAIGAVLSLAAGATAATQEHRANR